MNYDDIKAARDEADRTIRLADVAVRGAVVVAAGRLQAACPNPALRNYDASTDALRRLKAELRDFNAVTCPWKDLK